MELWGAVAEGSECRKALRHEHFHVLVNRKVSVAQSVREGEGVRDGGRCTPAGGLDSVSFAVENVRRLSVEGLKCDLGLG